MSSEQNEKLLRRYFEEVWNGGNLAVLAELQDPEYVEHSKRFIPIWRRAFPDSRTTIDTLLTEGDTVVVGFTTRGTHLGALEGSLLPSWLPQPLLSTGKRVAYRGIFFYPIVGGRMQRQGHWGILDWSTLLRQLGFAPSPGDVGA